MGMDHAAKETSFRKVRRCIDAYFPSGIEQRGGVQSWALDSIQIDSMWAWCRFATTEREKAIFDANQELAVKAMVGIYA